MAYKTGDILVTGTWPIPIFDHYAIVFFRDGKGYIAHNSFKSKKVETQPLEEFLKRKVRRVIPVQGLTDEGIYNKVLECNATGKDYNLAGYNCESFVREVCGCNFGMDQRKQFFIRLGIWLAVAIVLYFIYKKFNP